MLTRRYKIMLFAAFAVSIILMAWHAPAPIPTVTKGYSEV